MTDILAIHADYVKTLIAAVPDRLDDTAFLERIENNIYQLRSAAREVAGPASLGVDLLGAASVREEPPDVPLLPAGKDEPAAKESVGAQASPAQTSDSQASIEAPKPEVRKPNARKQKAPTMTAAIIRHLRAAGPLHGKELRKLLETEGIVGFTDSTLSGTLVSATKAKQPQIEALGGNRWQLKADHVAEVRNMVDAAEPEPQKPAITPSVNLPSKPPAWRERPVDEAIGGSPARREQARQPAPDPSTGAANAWLDWGVGNEDSPGFAPFRTWWVKFREEHGGDSPSLQEWQSHNRHERNARLAEQRRPTVEHYNRIRPGGGPETAAKMYRAWEIRDASVEEFSAWFVGEYAVRGCAPEIQDWRGRKRAAA